VDPLSSNPVLQKFLLIGIIHSRTQLMNYKKITNITENILNDNRLMGTINQAFRTQEVMSTRL
jgi:hypothetical protein